MASNYGIKISKKGYDAKTCSDKDLTLTSKYNTFKVIKTALVNWEAVPPASGEIVTIYHNLGYKPGFFAYLEVDGTDGRWMTDVYSPITGVNSFSNMFDDRLEINISGNPGDSGTLRYYIFADVIE